MAAPDPATAASAWLARIAPAQLAAADAYTNSRLVGWTIGALVFLALCLLVARTDALGRLRRAIEAERPRPWLSAAAAAGALTLLLGAAGAVVSGVCAWRGDALLALGGGVPAAASLAAHLAHAAAGVVPSTLAAVLLVPPLFWLMRRWPRGWPLIAGGLVMAVMLGLGWLPYALSAGPSLTPAPPGPAQAGVLRLIAETGLPAQSVLASPDPSFDADVTGGFGRAKVVLGPQMLAGPPAEARALVGHIMGHYVHDDILNACVIFAGVLVVGLFAVPPWGAPLARWLGARTVSSSADPEALPALAVIGFLAATLAALAGSFYLRVANVGADAYSLDHAREPDGLAAVIVREWDHQSVDPTPIEAAIFYTHPPLKGRLAHAMTWKAAHGG